LESLNKKKELLKSVIIVAGGSGKRMNNLIPKQFLLLRDLPVLMHTVLKFYNFNADIEIVLVLPENNIEIWKNLCKKHQFNINHKMTKGGKERFFSVKNGLDLIEHKSGLIAIHDGVRPLIDSETILKGLLTAEKHQTAIPVIDVTDSIRLVEKDKNFQLDRNKLKRVQTPQIFDIQLIKEAYKKDFNPDYTDDASVVEAAGHKIFLFEGNIENIKITTKFDLDFAEFLTTKFSNIKQ